MGQWVTGTMIHVTHPDLLTHLTYDPWPTDPLSALSRRSLALAREFGASIPKSRTRTQTPQISHKIGGIEVINVQISWKYAWFSFPCFRRTPQWIGCPWEWDDFHFSESQPTWNQPDLSSVYMAACLLHLRNKNFASLLGDRRDLTGLIIRPDWLKTLSLATELHGAEKSCKASGH